MLLQKTLATIVTGPKADIVDPGTTEIDDASDHARFVEELSHTSVLIGVVRAPVFLAVSENARPD